MSSKLFKNIPYFMPQLAGDYSYQNVIPYLFKLAWFDIHQSINYESVLHSSSKYLNNSDNCMKLLSFTRQFLPFHDEG